ncbi:hypothetical protein BX659_1263 [Orenia metallireducens]|uniref:Uncharacterized protein n=1 Tax=Orenia metallireducens TaxID=1413210 RepID=A0A285I1N5_9FIRM|nr:hypothetical protein [Orenia metallireducens]PRX23224.1 hypothetical protein BX659_1263 [Orenia metallireducens]SNY41869.1 hypothetical protein SAMN06265827_1293 [Orenia metallireducens]
MNLWNLFGLISKDDYKKLDAKLDRIMRNNSNRLDVIEDNLIKGNKDIKETISHNESGLKNILQENHRGLDKQILSTNNNLKALIKDKIEVSIDKIDNMEKAFEIKSNNELELLKLQQEKLGSLIKESNKSLVKNINNIKIDIINKEQDLVETKSKELVDKLNSLEREIKKSNQKIFETMEDRLEEQKKDLYSLKEGNINTIENISMFKEEILDKYQNQIDQLLSKVKGYEEKFENYNLENYKKIENLKELNEDEKNKIQDLQKTLDIIQQLIKITWVNDLMDTIEDNIE